MKKINSKYLITFSIVGLIISVGLFIIVSAMDRPITETKNEYYFYPTKRIEKNDSTSIPRVYDNVEDKLHLKLLNKLKL